MWTVERGRWGSLCTAVLLYGVLWIGWEQGWVWLSSLDTWLLNALSVDHAGWVRAWDVLCTFLGPNAFRIISLIAIILLLVQRYRRTALFLFLSIEFSGLVTEFAKRSADRPRPVTAMVNAYGTSFPSGHALAAMVGVLALLTVVLPMVSHIWRILLVVLGATVVIVVGVGRVVLNVHYPSDVVAGWALGYLYYWLCVAIVRPVPMLRTGPPVESPAVPAT